LAVAVAACLAAAGEAVPLPAPPADTPHFRPAVQLAVGLLVFAADAVLRKVDRHAEQDAMPPTASATATADAAAATVTSGCCGGRATATAAGEDGKLRSGEVASNGGGGGGTGAVASAAAVREVRRLLASEGSGLRAELEATRQRGYSTDNEEFMPGMTALAVPVWDAQGKLLATLS
ncbi:MAG: IclR family transcriptional regulator C-terminal domain-containing protein, partial [Pseudomonadota bacterium]